MTRAEVVRVTRLSPLAVEALEEDRFEVLPARVFVVGYLRLYASAIGMNPDEAVLRYEEWGLANPDAVPPAPPPPKPLPRRRFPWVPVAVGAGAIALGALLLWWLA
jgi:cytoskeletal protein RodZ